MRQRSPSVYGKYGLTRNPFPSIPITSTWSEQPFLRKIFQKEILRLRGITRRSLSENLEIVYLLGSGGSGKSALLKFFLGQVCPNFRTLTPIYMKCGSSNSFAPLYRSAISWLGKDFIESLCFNKFSRGSLSGLFSDFILNPSLAYMNLLFVGDRTKFPIFVTLLNMIRDEDSKILLGIDGLENVFENFSQMQKIDIFYGFNRLIDGVDEDILLFLTLNRDIFRWLQINQMDLELLNVRPLFREAELLLIEKLSVMKASDLVAFYLKKGRVRNHPEDELFPFTEKAIRLIHEASEGNIRRFLIFCHDLLSFSVGRNCDRINENVVSSYLSLPGT